MQKDFRIPKQLLWGLLPGLIGIVLAISPLGMMVEEGLGLQSLFLLRGHRTPPSQVSQLSIDSASLEELGLSDEKASDWPRSLYIEIIRHLNAQGAKLIVFTLALDELHTEPEEQAFSDALALSANVVLPRYITQRLVRLENSHTIMLNVVVPPVPLLEETALASAVFPLPKDTEKVTRFWTYKQEVSEPSTLPVVVFHLWAIDREYPAFLDLISGLDSGLAAKLPLDAYELHKNGDVHDFIRNMRDFFNSNPDLWARANQLIDPSPTWSASTREILSSWIKLYSEQSTVYLNHYGQSATITRWPLINLLKHRSGSPFKDSVVFVGISENLFMERNYGFHTVFSSPTARISVAEIAATATANIMADELIQPIPFAGQIILIFAWGFLIGLVSYFLSIPRALLAIFCLSSIYIAIAILLFEKTIWIPLIVPLLILVPVSLLLGFACRYRRNQIAQKAIHKAFSHYIPPAMVDKLASQTRLQDFRDEAQVVYAVCLSTDAGQFTRLGEIIDPSELAKLMNDYYEIMFGPVQRYQGFISDVVGDAMLALWTGSQTDPTLVANACQAALTIHTAVEQFNNLQQHPLPTRFGMHAGQIRLGNIGSSSRFEYRPVGDCVNTSNRIERLNKLLGTHLLISADVVPDEHICITRHVGSFLLEGKSNPLNIYELVGIPGQVSDSQIELNKLFDQGLVAYTKGDLETAQHLFDIVLQHSPSDGPSIFYYQRCGLYLSNKDSTITGWASTIRM